MATLTIKTKLQNGKAGDTYNVFSAPTLRAHIADGHPTDTADMLLYFFLREHLEGDVPDGNPGTSYSLFCGTKKVIDGSLRGVPAALDALDSLKAKRRLPLKAVA